MFCQYNEEYLNITDSVTWHIFHFKREKKTDLSSLTPLMTIKWVKLVTDMTELIRLLSKVLQTMV